MVEGPPQYGREPGEFPSVLAELAPRTTSLWIASLARSISALRRRRRPASSRSPASLASSARRSRAWVWRGWSSTSLADSRRRARGSPPRSASQTRRAAIASGGADSAGIRAAASQNRASSSVATASSRRARQTAGSSGRRPRHRSSHTPASPGRPTRIACRARPSQTRSSSGSAASRKTFQRVGGRGFGVVLPEILEQLGRVGVPTQAAMSTWLTSA